MENNNKAATSVGTLKSMQKNFIALHDTIINSGILNQINDKDLFFDNLLQALCKRLNHGENSVEIIISQFTAIFYDSEVK